MTGPESDYYYRTNAPLRAYMEPRDEWTTQQFRQPTYTRTQHQQQLPEPWPEYYPPQAKPKRPVLLWLALGVILAAVAAAVILAYGQLANHPASTAAVQANNNTLVCQHYKTQRAWVKGLAMPSLTDALKFATWVAADAAESTGTLHTNLAAMSADEQHNKSSYVASEKVIASCQALGVQF